MKTVCFLFGLVLQVTFSLAQQSNFYMVTTNGQQINYLNYSIKGKKVIIKQTDNKGKKEVWISRVLGYYSRDEHVMYYKMPDNTSFLHRVADGKISLYEKVEVAYRYIDGTGGYSSVETKNLYTLKNGKLQIVYDGKPLKKKKNVSTLKILFAGQPEAINMISNAKNINYQTVLKAVNTYNYLTYKPPQLPEKFSQGAVIFYRDRKKKKAKTAIHVGNDKVIELSANSYQTIRIPTKYLTAICLKTSTMKMCGTYKATPYFTKYYKVIMNKDGGIDKIVNVRKKVAQFDIGQINRSKY